MRDMIKNSTMENRPVTRVTNVRTIAEAMSTSDIYKSMLSEVNKLLKLYFPLPVTTAKVQDLLVKYECLLNNLFLLYIHTEKNRCLGLVQSLK